MSNRKPKKTAPPSVPKDAEKETKIAFSNII
jgi:hypothetical protein